LFLHHRNPVLLVSLSSQVYCWCFHLKTKEGERLEPSVALETEGEKTENKINLKKKKIYLSLVFQPDLKMNLSGC